MRNSEQPASSTKKDENTGFFSTILQFFQKDPKESIQKEKKLLVLDIDETLVHSSAENPSKGFDFNVSTVVSGQISKLYVKKRPGLDEFMQELSLYYEIYTYTSSMKEYSDQIIENIDPQSRYIKKSLCRHNCVYANGVYIKDLSKLKRKLKDVIIIDNSKTAFLLHKPNGILIPPFYDDPHDRELKRMISFLKFLANVYDIRPVEEWRKTFYESPKIEYLDYRKEKSVFLNEYSLRNSIREGNDVLCRFANMKKEVEKTPWPEFEETDQNEELKKALDRVSSYTSLEVRSEEERLSNASPRIKGEGSYQSKEITNTNSFMKIKKDFNDRKSKILRNEQKPMMFMHDC